MTTAIFAGVFDALATLMCQHAALARELGVSDKVFDEAIAAAIADGRASARAPEPDDQAPLPLAPRRFSAEWLAALPLETTITSPVKCAQCDEPRYYSGDAATVWSIPGCRHGFPTMTDWEYVASVLASLRDDDTREAAIDAPVKAP